MERIAQKSVLTLTPNGTNTIDFVLSPDLVRWTIHVYPKDDSGGAFNDSTVELQYGVGSDYLSINPAASAVALTNKDNPITLSDQVSKVRLKITNGATPPNKGITAEIYGARDAAR